MVERPINYSEKIRDMATTSICVIIYSCVLQPPGKIAVAMRWSLSSKWTTQWLRLTNLMVPLRALKGVFRNLRMGTESAKKEKKNIRGGVP